MRVADWLDQHPCELCQVSETAPLKDVLDALLQHDRLRDVYVTDAQGSVVGYLSYRRLGQLLLNRHHPTTSRRHMMEAMVENTAGELMDGHFTYARSDDDLLEVAHDQLQQHIECIPVLDEDNRLKGAIQLRQVLAHLREINGL